MTEKEFLKKLLNEVTGTKNIHALTPEERIGTNNGFNSVIDIRVDSTFITGGTLKERSELVGETITERIKPDDIRYEEDPEMYILEDCILVVGYTLCAILDINKPWEGVSFPCYLIHDLR